MQQTRYEARMGKKRGAQSVLVQTPEETRPLGRPTRRWKDNIKMYLQIMGVEWIDLARNRTDTGLL